MQQERTQDGGVAQQRQREQAEGQARTAAQTGDKYSELLAEGLRYDSKQDRRRAGRAYREAIALRPDKPVAYLNLAAALNDTGHTVEAAQRFLEAKECVSEGSELWAQATSRAFEMLTQKTCAEVAKPEWWNDKGLKALSARVVRAAPNGQIAQSMRAAVLCGTVRAWEVGPRSAAELSLAATCFERAAALCNAPVGKATLTGNADKCCSLAEVM